MKRFTFFLLGILASVLAPLVAYLIREFIEQYFSGDRLPMRRASERKTS